MCVSKIIIIRTFKGSVNQITHPNSLLWFIWSCRLIVSEYRRNTHRVCRDDVPDLDRSCDMEQDKPREQLLQCDLDKRPATVQRVVARSRSECADKILQLWFKESSWRLTQQIKEQFIFYTEQKIRKLRARCIRHGESTDQSKYLNLFEQYLIQMCPSKN